MNKYKFEVHRYAPELNKVFYRGVNITAAISRAIVQNIAKFSYSENVKNIHEKFSARRAVSNSNYKHVTIYFFNSVPEFAAVGNKARSGTYTTLENIKNVVQDERARNAGTKKLLISCNPDIYKTVNNTINYKLKVTL